MAKIELGREYKTRDGGRAVVYRDDGRGSYPMLGAVELADGWDMTCWTSAGKYIHEHDHPHDLILPRTVMVPVEVPEWANYVTESGIDGFGYKVEFWEDKNPNTIPIDEWLVAQGAA